MTTKAGPALRGATLLLAVFAVGGCRDPVAEPPGVRLEARQDVLLSTEPLGDVVTGELSAGQDVTALCLVTTARSNTGVRGSAVRVEVDGMRGYAAATDFPARMADRRPVFDLDPAALRDTLPRCSG